MTTSRLQQRDLLLVGLGYLVDPIRRLIGDGADRARRLPYVRSQFASDLILFQGQLNAFCSHGKHRFDAEYNAARRATNRFTPLFEQLQQGRPDDQVLQAFDETLQATVALVRAIPADDEDAIIPAGSPFSAFLQIRALSAAAVARLDLIDPYLDAEAYHRYLADVPSLAIITVVSDVRSMQPAAADTRAMLRRDRILAVSTLLAEQRPDTYRLLVAERLHDRHLRVDDDVYHLGGSLKDAARTAAYSLTRMDGTEAVRAMLDDQLKDSVTWYPDERNEHRRE